MPKRKKIVITLKTGTMSRNLNPLNRFHRLTFRKPEITNY